METAGHGRAPGAAERITRAGRVAIVGRTNVGKSTLLNAALSMPQSGPLFDEGCQSRRTVPSVCDKPPMQLIPRRK